MLDEEHESQISETYPIKFKNIFESTQFETIEEEVLSQYEPDYLPIYKEMLVLHEVYDQEYDYGENPLIGVNHHIKDLFH